MQKTCVRNYKCPWASQKTRDKSHVTYVLVPSRAHACSLSGIICPYQGANLAGKNEMRTKLALKTNTGDWFRTAKVPERSKRADARKMPQQICSTTSETHYVDSRKILWQSRLFLQSHRCVKIAHCHLVIPFSGTAVPIGMTIMESKTENKACACSCLMVECCAANDFLFIFNAV